MRYINAHPEYEMNMFYSTPSIYIEVRTATSCCALVVDAFTVDNISLQNARNSTCTRLPRSETSHGPSRQMTSSPTPTALIAFGPATTVVARLLRVSLSSKQYLRARLISCDVQDTCAPVRTCCTPRRSSSLLPAERSLVPPPRRTSTNTKPSPRYAVALTLGECQEGTNGVLS
jgi:hypothetical protein